MTETNSDTLQMLDIRERRRLLRTSPNPSGRLDYVVTITGHVPGEAPALPVSLTLRYVPDRDILDPNCLDAYYDEVARGEWSSIEEVAVTILDDFNNEIVPRWLSVTISRRDETSSTHDTHSIVLEDRQPRWDNARLLGRMEKY